MNLDAISSFVQSLGLPVAMLFAFGWWIVRKDEQQRGDIKALNDTHRTERAEQGAAFLAALDKSTDRIEENTHSLDQLGEAIRDLRRSA